MYSGDNAYYSIDDNGKPGPILGNSVAKIGEWFIRFIEGESPNIQNSELLISKSPYDLIEYEFNKDNLRSYYKDILDYIFSHDEITIKTFEDEIVPKFPPIRNLNFTEIIEREYKIKHSIIKSADGKYKLLRSYIIDNLSEALSVELLQLIEHEILLKKCENCDRYFFPKDNTEKYCDRTIMDGKTCKDVGYIRKVENNKYLKLYTTAYRTKHAQKQRKTRNNNPVRKEKYEAALKRWRSIAKASLKEAQEGKITLEKFEKILAMELEVE
jgi:hypothetical protein